MRRRGFTVIELLVVIGILAILAAVIGYAMTGMTSRMKKSSTQTTLQNLKSMTSELRAVGHGLTRQPAAAYVANAAGALTMRTNPPGPLDIWNDADPDDGPLSAGNLVEPDPFPVPVGNMSRSSAATPNAMLRYTAPVMFNTQQVIGLLLLAPNNKKVIAQFQSSQLMETLPTGTATAGMNINFIAPAPGQPLAATPAMPLDAWGNPMIFVPAGGLSGVWVGYNKGDPTNAASYTNANFTVVSPDRQPFWASAGPDGDFRTGDDNIYSFEE